jgi:hypothetical protein
MPSEYDKQARVKTFLLGQESLRGLRGGVDGPGSTSHPLVW